MGKPSIPGLELERSMNMQVTVMTVEETMRHIEVIDGLDDKRREKMQGVIQWAKDMQKSFAKDMQQILKISDGEIYRQTNELLEKYKKFTKRFENSIDTLMTQEIELEKIDDNSREYLINYAAETRERLRNENSNIEKEIIKKRAGL